MQARGRRGRIVPGGGLRAGGAGLARSRRHRLGNPEPPRPAAIIRSTRKLYHKSPAITDLREFNDRGHSLTIDHRWREIADEVLSWLSQRVK